MHWVFVCLLFLNLGYYGFQSMSASSSLAGDISVEASRPAATADGARLALLSEIQTDQLQELTSVAPKSAAKTGSAFCPSIGPYLAKRQGLRFIQALNERDVRALLSHVILEQSPDHWVVTETYENRQQALLQLRNLQAEKVDSYIITDGELANAVSLGLYSDSARAAALRDRLQALDYSVEIKTVPRTELEYWVKIPGEELHKIPSNQLQELIQNTSQSTSSIGISQSPCEWIAHRR